MGSNDAAIDCEQAQQLSPMSRALAKFYLGSCPVKISGEALSTQPVPRHAGGNQSPSHSTSPDRRRCRTRLGQRVHLVRAKNSSEWKAGLAAGGTVTPFHDWDWLHGQAKLQGWRHEPLLVRRGPMIVGAIPLLLQHRGPLWTAVSTPFPYAGPVVGDADAADALFALLRWSRRHGVLVTRLDFPDGDRTVVEAALTQSHSEVTKPNTFMLDLTGGVDSIRSRYTRSVRNSIKAAAKNGVTVSAATETEVVELLPAVLDEAFTSRGIASPYPRDIGRWAWNYFKTHSAIALTAHFGDHPVGLLTAIGAGSTMYGWAGGAFRQHRNLRGSHALHAATFEQAAAMGYEQFDLVGEVDEGVNNFKMAFGAVPTPFVLAQQTTYPVYSLARRWQHRRHAGLSGTPPLTLVPPVMRDSATNPKSAGAATGDQSQPSGPK